MGGVYYMGYLDYDHALQELAAAQQLNSNDGDIPTVIAGVKRRQGKFDEAAELLERGVSLDPYNANNHFTLGATYALLRRYSEAQKRIERAVSLAPTGIYYARKARFALLQGDIETARAALTEAAAKKLTSPFDFYYRAMVELFAQDYPAALARLSSDESDVLDYQFLFLPKALFQAQVLALMGQSESSAQQFDLARRMLEDKIRAQPEDDRYYGSLGIAYAGLGRKQEAIEAGRKGMELCPMTKEAWRATYRIEDMAHIYTMLGEYEEAVKNLDFLLSVPAEVSVASLLSDPTWTPLRNHPGFQELIRKYRH
jgi:tetratricopeptide (TPR) repeat protein